MYPPGKSSAELLARGYTIAIACGQCFRYRIHISKNSSFRKEYNVRRLLVLFAMIGSAFAQQAPPGGGTAARPAATAAPLFLKVDWVRPKSQEDTKIRYTPVQENVADPNVEIKFYGAGAKQILTTGVPGSDVKPDAGGRGTAWRPLAPTCRPNA